MALWFATRGGPQGWSPADLMAVAKPAGEVFAVENEYVRVRYQLLEYPAAEADPPRDTIDEMQWEGGRLLVATFKSMHFGDGTGPCPSVTIFLSDGVVDVSHDGVRRRMGVRAGDAFWFEARTGLRVVSDHPVGAAIVQIDPRQSRARL